MEIQRMIKWGTGLGLVGIGWGVIVTAEKVVVALSRECEINISCLNTAMTYGLAAVAVLGASTFIVRRLKK